MSRPRRRCRRPFTIAATASSCSRVQRHGSGENCSGRGCCEFSLAPRSCPPKPAFGRMRGEAKELPSRLLPPGRKILQRLLVGGGIEAEDATALADFLGDKILERRHLEGFVGDLIRQMRRDRRS